MPRVRCQTAQSFLAREQVVLDREIPRVILGELLGRQAANSRARFTSPGEETKIRNHGLLGTAQRDARGRAPLPTDLSENLTLAATQSVKYSCSYR